jgi:hypothetical protein
MAEAAAREQMSYRGFLAELLMAECDDRARHRSERRIKAAAFPREKSLRTFDFDANPNVDPAVVHTLATCGSRRPPRSGRTRWSRPGVGSGCGSPPPPRDAATQQRSPCHLRDQAEPPQRLQASTAATAEERLGR